MAATPGELPPILVHRETMTVIDGMHRLTAAMLRGQREVLASFFCGPPEDAFVEAVRRNVRHGKPLSVEDRERAAERILTTHPHWSDRSVADACGISPRKVAQLRKAVLRQCPPEARLGRDGRLRPVDASTGRLQAAQIIQEQPNAPLREVARRAGTSVGTARDVRHRLTQGRHPLPDRARVGSPPTAVTSARGYVWSTDRAVAASDIGAAFVTWFEASDIRSELWRRFTEKLPLSRLYLVSDESRRRSREWDEFAAALDQRARRERGS